ncbi:homeobox protein SIX5-like [Bolinopsis microptera]|uniref:homeobox protein SIX5-like n=1 Tax=Bolinopsis microptera TaxID=2820187 RepID=UPI003079B943
METFTYPSYQDLTSLCDIPVPAPLPVSPFYLSWTIPLSFNFTFPEMELPSRCQDNLNCTPNMFTVSVMETFTGSENPPPNKPSQIHLPEKFYADMSDLPPLTSSYRSPVPSPTSSPASSPSTTNLNLSDQAITAQSLFEEKQYAELKSYLSVTYFPSSDHPHLQKLYYNSLYELYKISSGKRHLMPTTKYRLRKSNPLPSTISSVKFQSNNHFDDNARSLLLAVFKRERTPSQETISSLRENTGLTEKQIRNFFKNKRSRA